MPGRGGRGHLHRLGKQHPGPLISADALYTFLPPTPSRLKPGKDSAEKLNVKGRVPKGNEILSYNKDPEDPPPFQTAGSLGCRKASVQAGHKPALLHLSHSVHGQTLPHLD